MPPIKLTERHVVGTRAYGKAPDGTYRHVCATCGAGGTTPYRTLTAAGHVACNFSGHKCQTCGAD